MRLCRNLLACEGHSLTNGQRASLTCELASTSWEWQSRGGTQQPGLRDSGSKGILCCFCDAIEMGFLGTLKNQNSIKRVRV